MKLCATPDARKINLAKAQYVMNNTFHTSIKGTPSTLLLGYEQRNHTECDSHLKEVVNELVNIESNSEESRQKSKEVVFEVANKIKMYNKNYYDSRHKKPTPYRIGDYVLIRNLQAKKGESRKIKPSYKGLYMVAKILSKNRYVVLDIPGFNITSKPYNTILSPDKMN